MDLKDRLQEEIKRLVGSSASANNRIGLAVSGGPDSLALLLMAHEAFGTHIEAATVDHGLRPEASAEAAFVASICADRDIPHAILTPPEPITGNIQSEARAVRYALLDRWREDRGLQWIATAHHADDQLETVLMRLLRGSGIDGLSAIRPVNGHVIRPLLNVRKSTLENYVADQGITAISDPSNKDRAFDRVRLRQLLVDFPAYEPHRLESTLSAVREASEALAWAAQNEGAHAIAAAQNAIYLERTDYPPEILRRLVLQSLKKIAPDIAPRGATLDRFIETLKSGKKATIGDILGNPAANHGTTAWRFTLAPPRKTG